MAVAKQHGLKEELAQAAFNEPELLSDTQQAAIALADALMTQPGQLAPETAAELRSHFTEEQLVELTLDIMKWNYQKVVVATGVDAEVRPGELTDLRFDDDGLHHIGPG